METSSSPGRMAVGLLLLMALAWGVLRAGASLSAPPPLGAAWVVQAPAGCAPDAPTWTLSQSGVFLDAQWPNGPVSALHGRLEGERVSLAGLGGRCATGPVHLDGTWTPAGLTARLVAPGCGACDGATLTATRSAP